MKSPRNCRPSLETTPVGGIRNLFTTEQFFNPSAFKCCMHGYLPSEAEFIAIENHHGVEKNGRFYTRIREKKRKVRNEHQTTPNDVQFSINDLFVGQTNVQILHLNW